MGTRRTRIITTNGSLIQYALRDTLYEPQLKRQPPPDTYTGQYAFSSSHRYSIREQEHREIYMILAGNVVSTDFPGKGVRQSILELDLHILVESLDVPIETHLVLDAHSSGSAHASRFFRMAEQMLDRRT